MIGTEELAGIIADTLEDRDDIARAEVVAAFNGHAVMITTQGGKGYYYRPIVTVPDLNADANLSPADLERLYGERTCPWPECDYVAVGEYEAGLHADDAHGLKAPAFLVAEPAPDVASVHLELIALRGLVLNHHAELLERLGPVLGLVERYGPLLERLEGHPMLRMMGGRRS